MITTPALLTLNRDIQTVLATDGLGKGDGEEE